MYRKTRFNHDKDAGQEPDIRYRIRRLGSSLRSWVERYPLYALAAMLLCILASGILAFTVMRSGAPQKLTDFPQPPPSNLGAAIGGVVRAYDAMQELSEIQREIQGIIEKDSLGTADSIRLTEALQRFEQLQLTLSENENREP